MDFLKTIMISHLIFNILTSVSCCFSIFYLTVYLYDYIYVYIPNIDMNTRISELNQPF